MCQLYLLTGGGGAVSLSRIVMVAGVTPAGGSWFFLRIDAMMEAE